MNSKLQLALHMVLLPYSDMTFFYNNALERGVVEKSNYFEMIKSGKSLGKKGDPFADWKKAAHMIRAKLLKETNLRNHDEILMLLEKYYLPYQVLDQNEFSSLGSLKPYSTYAKNMSKLVKLMYSHRDGSFVFKYWKNPEDSSFLGISNEFRKVMAYQQLSRIVPQDFLICQYLLSSNVGSISQLDGFYGHIHLADSQLEDVLAKGIAENHLHAGAAFNFNILWQFVICQAAVNKLDTHIKGNELEIEGFSTHVIAYLYCDLNIRRVLTAMIKNQHSLKDMTNDEIGLFQDWIRFEKTQVEDKTFQIRVQDMLIKLYLYNNTDHLEDWIFTKFEEDLGVSTYGECIFLYHALKKQKDLLTKGTVRSDKDASLYLSLLQRYLMIKHEFFKQCTQGDALKGLDFFQEYYARSTGVFKDNKTNKYQVLFQTAFNSGYIQKMEIRQGPISSETELAKNLLEILKAYKSTIESHYRLANGTLANFPKIGLIYHFIKSEDKEVGKCWQLSIDERNKVSTVRAVEKSDTYLRYGKIQRNYMEQLDLINKLRNSSPYLSYFILGIDAASLENNTPVEVFAPVYQKARDSIHDYLVKVDGEGNKTKVKSLAFTFHAGEDFRHILSGLRRMDEVIDWCKFHSGDRIGHGTALGLDAKYWTLQNEVVVLPRQEYLDNLLWIWGVFGEPQYLNPKFVVYLEKEIFALVRDIYPSTAGLTIEMLYESYRRNFEGINDLILTLSHEQKPCGIASKIKNLSPQASSNLEGHTPSEDSQIWSLEKLICSRHCDCFLEKMREPIFRTTSELDYEIIETMQIYLRKKISQKGIVLETNPSSNAIIGEMKDIYEHHSHSLNKPREEALPNVQISINSDDPLVFNTSLVNEYAYIYYGLIEKGYGKEQVLHWIEKNRISGMETSFIKDNLDHQSYFFYLEKAIEALGDN